MWPPGVHGESGVFGALVERGTDRGIWSPLAHAQRIRGEPSCRRRNRELLGHELQRRLEGLPLSLLADLKDQIRCEGISLDRSDSGRQAYSVLQSVPVPSHDELKAFEERDRDPAFWERFWTCHWECQVCSYPERTGDLRSVVKPSDFYSARQWHSTGEYIDILRPQGYEHQLQLCLPDPAGLSAGPGRTVRLHLFRGPGLDFTDRDRAVLTLLRPHLHQAYLDAERRRHPVPRLTPRQKDLLHLLAAGHTNAQIARRLGISEGTVRTHLENIYDKLNVSSRTAAVTRAFPTGPPSAYGGAGGRVVVFPFLAGIRGCSRSIHIAAVGDVYHRYHASLVIDSVDDPVSTTTRAKPVVNWRKQPFPDPVGDQQQRAGDELVGSSCNGFRQTLAQCMADGRGCPEFVGFFRGLPAHRARRCLMASASSSAETCSPRASSASDSANRCIVAASRMISRVSSSRSRSSGAIRTAEGLPCTVTVTRSW